MISEVACLLEQNQTGDTIMITNHSIKRETVDKSGKSPFQQQIHSKGKNIIALFNPAHFCNNIARLGNILS